jgi:hypothetical protein
VVAGRISRGEIQRVRAKIEVSGLAREQMRALRVEDVVDEIAQRESPAHREMVHPVAARFVDRAVEPNRHRRARRIESDELRARFVMRVSVGIDFCRDAQAIEGDFAGTFVDAIGIDDVEVRVIDARCEL